MPRQCLKHSALTTCSVHLYLLFFGRSDHFKLRGDQLGLHGDDLPRRLCLFRALPAAMLSSLSTVLALFCIYSYLYDVSCFYGYGHSWLATPYHILSMSHCGSQPLSLSETHTHTHTPSSVAMACFLFNHAPHLMISFLKLATVSKCSTTFSQVGHF